MSNMVFPLGAIFSTALVIVTVALLWRHVVHLSRQATMLLVIAMAIYYIVVIWITPHVMDAYSTASDTSGTIRRGEFYAQALLRDPAATLDLFVSKATLNATESTFSFYWIMGFIYLMAGGSPAGISAICAWFGTVGGSYFIEAFSRVLKKRNWYPLLVLFLPSIIFWLTWPLKDAIVFWLLGMLAAGLATFVQDCSWQSVWKILLAEIACIAIRPYYGIFFLAPLMLIGLWYAVTALRTHSSDRFWSSICWVAVNALVLFFLISNQFFTIAISVETASVYQQTAGQGGGANIQPQVVMAAGQTAFGNYLTYGIQRLWYIFTVLFRPMLWEAHNTFALIASLENSFLLLLALLVVWNSHSILRRVIREPVLVFAGLFVALFVGAFSFQVVNLGTMMRVKVNVLPFLFPFVALALEIAEERLSTQYRCVDRFQLFRNKSD
ncbi:MAG: hypothetical protein HY808_02865 [Nitrospirae bacterium]|nr:hypothetical protein [Nitrospirota bacterium]